MRRSIHVHVCAALLFGCAPSPAPPKPAPARETRTPATPAPRPAATLDASRVLEPQPEPTEPPPPPPPPPLPAVTGDNAVRRGPGRARGAENKAACRACNGSWGAHGMAGTVDCICATRDAGRPCKSPLDCEAECMVDDPDRYRDVRCGPSGCNGPEPVGRCAKWVLDFGCHARIVEMPYDGGVVREVQTICLD
jgi:hypothetical protein